MNYDGHGPTPLGRRIGQLVCCTSAGLMVWAIWSLVRWVL